MLCFLTATLSESLSLIWVRQGSLQHLTDIAGAPVLHVKGLGPSRLPELLHTPRQQLQGCRRLCKSKAYPS